MPVGSNATTNGVEKVIVIVIDIFVIVIGLRLIVCNCNCLKLYVIVFGKNIIDACLVSTNVLGAETDTESG